MRETLLVQVVLRTLVASGILGAVASANSAPADPNRYLNAVREFADNVLKYGRDTYGSKETPLFVDGLNIHTHEPVKWIAPNGDRWILSNLASQQSLFRTLDGLTRITGDPKYKQAAMEALEYAFVNLRSQTGLFYWGRVSAYDAQADTVRGGTEHSFKFYYPHYELMWEVNAKATEDFIEAFWATHIMDWANLEMNRYGPLNGLQVARGWDHEYRGGPVFFESQALSFIDAGSDLFYAGAMLSRLSGKKQPLVWSKRLAHRYVETRDPHVGISGYVYTRGEAPILYPFNDDFSGHSVLLGTLFPMNPGVGNPEARQRLLGELTVSPGIVGDVCISPYICELLLGEMLGSEGKEFMQWALEEITAWGKRAYRKKDNSFVPMLTDGTSLEGYVCKKDSSFGPKGTVFMPIPAVPSDLWAYALAYRMTGDSFMWDIARSIAQGNDLGDIGADAEGKTYLHTTARCSDPYALLGFLELHRRTRREPFLHMARRIADNILTDHFYKGFFVPSRRHVYAKFDAIDALVLLHFDAALNARPSQVPWVWPSRPTFKAPYRMRQEEMDNTVFYGLMDSAEPPKSLQEAAAAGETNEVKLLISKGANVNAWDFSQMSPLYSAVRNGHKDVVDLLLAKGADVNAKSDWRIETSLHYAAREGYKEIAGLLIGYGADVNAENSFGETPLFVACGQGRTDIAELLLNKSANINTADNKGSTLLHRVAQDGRTDLVEFLIARGADINAKNSAGQTPLDIAAGRNHKEIIELLLAKGAMVSTLHQAARLGDLDRVKAFLEKGSDVNAKDKNGETALHVAANSKRKDAVELLVSNGADINAKDKEGYTPLYYAIWNEDADMVRLLVDRGADVNVLPNDDGTPLEYAVWNKDVEMARLFVAKGARFDARDHDGWTAFRYAVSGGHRALVEFFVSKGADVSTFHVAACLGDLARVKDFLERGADVNAKDEMGWAPLYWAASTAREEVAEFLISKGARIDIKTKDDSTPLHQAARSGAVRLVELFISKGADVKAADESGSTPLHGAAARGHARIVQTLLAKGAEPNAKDRRGRTALDSAKGNDHSETAALLVPSGAKVNEQDEAGRTVLHQAASNGWDDIVQLALDRGADIYVQDKVGMTPLHYAAAQGHRNVANRLLTRGAHRDSTDNAGRIPLHYACGAGSLNGTLRVGYPDVAQLLLDNGSFINRPDKYGWTSLHYAVSQGNKTMVDLLLAKGADLNATNERGHTPLSLARRIWPVARGLPGEKDIIEQYSEIIQSLHPESRLYYVASDGKDTNPGTQDRPFGSLSAAVAAAEPGDTIYVRGGIHRCTGNIHISKSGEQGKPIRVRAYPGEAPVFDFSQVKGDGILITGAYWHLKGLAITKADLWGLRLETAGAHHNILERIEGHNNGLAGIALLKGAAYNLVVNCDSHHNFDPLANGQNADGFNAARNNGVGNLFIGCRAWNNSDDGFDCILTDNGVRMENCFAWRNGRNIWSHPTFMGNGSGFKLAAEKVPHVVIRCLAWGHGSPSDFPRPYMDDIGFKGGRAKILNCTAFQNRRNYAFWGSVQGNVFRNCISYAGPNVISSSSDDQSNSWRLPSGIEITANDFASLDDSVITGPRNPDGGIPESDFLRLAPGSHAIDAGTDVGLPFAGKAPGLGAFEYDPEKAKRQSSIKWLHQAVRDHDIARIRSMLAENAEVNEKDWLGYAPLHWACYFGYIGAAEILLANKADTNLKSDTGRTPLEIATSMEYENIADLLRKHGAKE